MKCEKCGNEMKNGVCVYCGEIDENVLVQITQCADDFDADIKISLLESCKIKAYKRYSGFSATAKIYCGNSNLGVRLYVSQQDAQTAKEILEAPFEVSELDFEVEE